jgi:hypothetical protein
MNRQDIIKEMKAMVGNQDPILFFDKMTDLFAILFDKVDELEIQLHHIKTNSALSIQWEPRVAADMISKEIISLKKLDKETYAFEIAALTKAYAEDHITQEYISFCQFWQDVLGWHPFLDYSK